jgi:hypothetical protein
LAEPEAEPEADTAQTTGTVSSTEYDGAGCVTRVTECGADNVNLPDLATCGDSLENSCDCAADDVTDKPAEVIHWTSGECITCSSADGTTECNWPFIDTSDDEFYPQVVAQGVDPAYAKITCANGVATVEHFSDAGCTAANKVSSADLAAAFQAVYAEIMAESPMGACLSIEENVLSGVNIQGSHCDEIMSMTADEVRLASPACGPDPPASFSCMQSGPTCALRSACGLWPCARHASPPLILIWDSPRTKQRIWRREWPKPSQSSST